MSVSIFMCMELDVHYTFHRVSYITRQYKSFVISISRLLSVLFICRRCFRCGADKVKFSAPQDLMCQASVACVEIQNVCPEDKFHEMAHNSDPFFLDFLLTMCA